MGIYYKDMFLKALDNKLLRWNGKLIRMGEKQYSTYEYPIDNLEAIWRFDGDNKNSWVDGYLDFTSSYVSYPDGGWPSSYSKCGIFGSAGAPYLDSSIWQIGDFSISLWFDASISVSPSQGFMITTAGNYYLRNGFVIGFEHIGHTGNPGKVYYGLAYSGVGDSIIVSDDSFIEGKWNHVVFTYNYSEKTYNLWLNGVDQGGNYYEIVPNYGRGVLGYNSTFNANALTNCKMASMFLYSKVLTETDVLNLYNNGNGN